MTIRRLLPRRDGDDDEAAEMVPLALWLDAMQVERDALIMRLRQVERILVHYGRLRDETLPRRDK